YIHFENGSIYYNPALGSGLAASVIYGAIRDKWALLGWERGRLGYPVGDEYIPYSTNYVRAHGFQHGGVVYWSVATGAHAFFTNEWSYAFYQASAEDELIQGRTPFDYLGLPTR